MRLNTILERCKGLEERAAALYRRYAAAARAEPSLCALWTALAREEEEHARAIAMTQIQARPTGGWLALLEGWEEALGEVDERLRAAEQLDAGASTAHQLSAALALEMTQLEARRQVLMAISDPRGVGAPTRHAIRLAEAAERLSDDPQVRLQAAVLRTRTQLSESA